MPAFWLENGLVSLTMAGAREWCMLSDGHCTDVSFVALSHCAGVLMVFLYAKGLAFWNGGIHGNGRKGLV